MKKSYTFDRPWEVKSELTKILDRELGRLEGFFDGGESNSTSGIVYHIGDSTVLLRFHNDHQSKNNPVDAELIIEAQSEKKIERDLRKFISYLKKVNEGYDSSYVRQK
ncbi:MAG: hypothetical protein RL557_336 [archaeon]|jgi:hypothetical protein